MCAIVVRAREMERAEAEALLSDLHVGAMAFAFRDRVAITLVNFVYRDGWVYARIEDGPNLDMLRHHQWVALEARDASGIYDWRSVTVNGSVDLLSDTGSPREVREFHEATSVLRSVVPAILTEHDPFPRRVQLFRMRADVVAGREARTHIHDSSSSEFVPLTAIGEQ